MRPCALWVGLLAVSGAGFLAGCRTGERGADVARAPEPPADFYVATRGNDAWSGRLAQPNRDRTDGPFATLERARDAVRRLTAAGPLAAGGVTVEVLGGAYELSRPFELTKQDAGTAEAPVVYRAAKGAEVRLVGGRRVTGWGPVLDSAVLARLDESVRAKVVQADLKALGITDYGDMGGGFGVEKGPGLELFFADQPMTLARWPNEGFVRVVDVLGSTPVDVRGTKGCKEGIFEYEGDRPARWQAEKDPWAHGFWFWDWADQRQRIAGIDPAKHVITLAPPFPSYGYRRNQWFYAFNLLSEIDQPGEWYLDRQTGILYFYPPTPVDKGCATVSLLDNLVVMKDAAHVTLRGMILEAARGTAVTMADGTGCRIAGCTIRNVGGWAATISGGTTNGVIGCDITATGDGGVLLKGGDRISLTPAGHYAENNHIHHYSRWNPVYRFAVYATGVGQKVRHNLIHDSPHTAIKFDGNDHLIEFNEIHSVCYMANDAGMMHPWCNWTIRGTVIRYNYLHHSMSLDGPGCAGLYLDDMTSGVHAYGNVFYKVVRPVFVGGGRDDVFENNIMVDCHPAVHVDARALGWAKGAAEAWSREATEKGTLCGMPYRQAPWTERFPQLTNILAEEPAAPKGTIVKRNIIYQCDKWDEIEGKARPYVTLEDNLIAEDPHFVDAARQNFQLRDDSPAWRLGFQRIPIEKIGLYNDEFRASWPVKHAVRPAAARPKAPDAPPPAPQPHPTAACTAKKVVAPVSIDGVVSAGEWPEPALPMKETPDRQPVKGPPATLRVCHDGTTLYVAITVPVAESAKLKPGAGWGQDDGAEVVFRDASRAKPGPTFAVHGFAAGAHEAIADPDAPPDATGKLGTASRFAAKVSGNEWTGEWAVPLGAVGIKYRPGLKLGFNAGVLRTETNEWIIWAGALGSTMQLDNGGNVVLE
ncbi:MAG: hypothetical protein A3K19_23835 [Lentisphaerae bacterium RIFOXYB12_FULL_65_16]|nr:MAG: hypothetical protein A3K18_30680 [Lentisphaerae bacterium RIFOXYA12_64_32]OGV89621.1 MAG: hypothetical protein A3K19_23835 [Lentisphaerae bacterium RIFOXYB12_FULL_65_16]